MLDSTLVFLRAKLTYLTLLNFISPKLYIVNFFISHHVSLLPK